MSRQSFSKFIRPEAPARGKVTDRDLDILAVILRYRFCSALQIVHLVGGNEDVTHRRIRRLWEQNTITRWAFPGLRSHSEFYYYLDNRAALELLAEYRGLEIQGPMLDEIRNNAEKDYAGAALRGQHMQLGFLQHSLMISRMHCTLELACRNASTVHLQSWLQGGVLAGHKVEVPHVTSTRDGSDYFWQESTMTQRLPVEPDALFTFRFSDSDSHRLAHFCFEADRGTMTTTDMLKKFRAYFHFIKKQQRHKEAFGVHPIRAVLIETTNETRGKKLMELVNHPLVCGPSKRAGLFWFSISPVFTEISSTALKPPPAPPLSHRTRSHFLTRVWALPDRTMRSLCDAENSLS